MSDSKPLIDPKDLVPAVQGFVLGLGLLAFFFVLALGLGLTTFVNYGDVPYQ
ncbi:MAG: hypothetical protein K8J09_02205 [Planctomycetes bacterium]|nr:hypothetical protein [Planctomycetota bacterium]MCC7396162.1 hypothetical protein [Planctomycetota bacterium]